ncbi:hypothetical protein K456DRAFT_41726 [Colletotrichum gloeosporioides 23]|nr:hypothetical protein K456DRAFT_41726 [Colletotrichum gloeosporioides 23]
MPRRPVQHLLLIGSSLFFQSIAALCGAGALKSCLEARVFRLEDGVSEQRAPRVTADRSVSVSLHCTSTEAGAYKTAIVAQAFFLARGEAIDDRLLFGCPSFDCQGAQGGSMWRVSEREPERRQREG